MTIEEALAATEDPYKAAAAFILDIEPPEVTPDVRLRTKTAFWAAAAKIPSNTHYGLAPLDKVRKDAEDSEPGINDSPREQWHVTTGFCFIGRALLYVGDCIRARK